MVGQLAQQSLADAQPSPSASVRFSRKADEVSYEASLGFQLMSSIMLDSRNEGQIWGSVLRLSR